jgi:flagellar hook-associated protein 3 FlgL
MLDEQTETNASVVLLYEANLSAEKDLDYAEAIGRFNQQMLALQAAQQSYVKVQGLSLFNYL